LAYSNYRDHSRAQGAADTGLTVASATAQPAGVPDSVLALKAQHGYQAQTVLAVLLVLAWLALLWGCSSRAAGTEIAQGHGAVPLSPDQCQANGEIQRAALGQPRPGYDGASVIEPGDQLAIDFYLNPEFNQDVTVGLDGKVSLRLVGRMAVAGKTPTQLAAELNQAYLRELRSPGVTVRVVGTPGRRVYVGGEVTHPGAVGLEPGMTVLQAISVAGGFTEYANKKKIVLIRRDACGQPHRELLNLKLALAHPENGENVALAPRDLLVVPPTTIANVDLFVKHYITGVMPLPPQLYMPLPVP
jgi:protein involved in polysaccharide export with SLBB domain